MPNGNKKLKHQNKKAMPNTTTQWVVDVVIAPEVGDFPDTGDEEVYYIDNSTSTDEHYTNATIYVWDGTEYVEFTGHRPPRPPAH